MLVTLKPLKGESFQVEIEAEAKVSDLKRKIAEQKPDMPLDLQKLILAGKILQDDQVINDLGMKPDGFIVVMVNKPKAPEGAAAAPAAAAAAPASTPAPASADPGPAAMPAGAMPTMPTDLPPALAELRDNPKFPQLAIVVMRMLSMQNMQVIQAMIQSLRAPHPQVYETLSQPQNFQVFVRMCQASALEMVAQQNPGMAAQMAAQAGAGGGGDAGMQAAPQQSAALTEDEKAAVDRLKDMCGVDEATATQAYLVCNKNEELAANFIFDQQG